LLSIPPSYVAAKEKEGGRVGALLSKFKANIDLPLAAILTLNTVAHTVGAIGVGAQAAGLWSDAYAFGINVAAVGVPVAMTLAILILSEIIPKTLGANYWRALAGFTVSALNIVIYALYPLVWFSQLITKLLKKDKKRSVLSRAEFTAMAEIIAKEGTIKESEHNIIQNLFRFSSIHAEDVMTPRTVVVAAEQNKSVGDLYDRVKDFRFTRIPIYDQSRDHVSGFVLWKDVLSEIIRGHADKKLKEIGRKILVVTAERSLAFVFNEFMQRRQHIAMVVDDYGGMAGVVTLEDIIETLLGMEIVDEYDRTVDMQKHARSLWEKRARKIGLT
jgi:CBS domain containing-hemolysin-like protein